MQLHALLALSCFVGFVLSSSDRMAKSRAESAVEAPCIGVPPTILTFVFNALFGAGDEVREPGWDLLFMSEMREPAAEGGARGVLVPELGLAVVPFVD